MNAAARIAGAREADKKERLEAGTPGVMGLSALKMAKKQAAALHESKVKEAAGPRLAALQARREKRDQMKRKGREKREDDRKQSVEDEKHELIRAATTLQAAFRGRQMRVYGCARRVVVIGATGLIGAAVCRNCLLCGFEVVGMTRDENSSTAQALRIAGVRLYKGDVDVEHEIDRFFAFAVHGSQLQGYTQPHTHIVESRHLHGAFATTTLYDGTQRSAEELMEREERRARLIVEAATRAGVRHLVVSTAADGVGNHDISSAAAELSGGRPAEPLLCRSKQRVERVLRESSLQQWTVLRPAPLMDNFWSEQTPWLHPHAPGRRGHGVVQHVVHRKVRQPLVWSDDVGALAARVLDQGDGKHVFREGRTWKGETLDCVGDELNGAQIELAFSRAFSRAQPRQSTAAPAASALRKARAGHDDTAQQLRFKYRRQLPASQCSCQWDKCYDACRAPQHARCRGMLSSLQDKLTRLREGDTAAASAYGCFGLGSVQLAALSLLERFTWERPVCLSCYVSHAHHPTDQAKPRPRNLLWTSSHTWHRTLVLTTAAPPVRS